jgi:hypothetical protein
MWTDEEAELLLRVTSDYKVALKNHGERGHGPVESLQGQSHTSPIPIKYRITTPNPNYSKLITTILLLNINDDNII